FSTLPEPEDPSGGGLLRKALLHVNQPSEVSEVPKPKLKNRKKNPTQEAKSFSGQPNQRFDRSAVDTRTNP
ncbi:hypothetical protein, partial [Brevundimonas sp.]|uniref:hypothetical protein n=1 Tax=Brevundimonas sp. TaxID=1871086 RepID=UPI00289D69AA